MIRSRLLPLLAAAAVALPLPAVAQQAATTSDLNNAVASANADVAEANATNEGQYQADLLAYRNAVAAHSAATLTDQARYDRQQNLYAAAMAAWRKQAADCQAGREKQCKNPEPDPKDFY